MLENRRKNQLKKSLILHYFDYKNYFHSLFASDNLRTSHFGSSLSKFMGFNPSYIFQEMFSRMSFIAHPVPSFKNISLPKKSIPSVNKHASAHNGILTQPIQARGEHNHQMPIVQYFQKSFAYPPQIQSSIPYNPVFCMEKNISVPRAKYG